MKGEYTTDRNPFPPEDDSRALRRTLGTSSVLRTSQESLLRPAFPSESLLKRTPQSVLSLREENRGGIENREIRVNVLGVLH